VVNWASPVYIGLALCLVALVIALVARKLTAAIGADLARTIDLGDNLDSRGPLVAADRIASDALQGAETDRA
jgi:hypothetical protein